MTAVGRASVVLVLLAGLLPGIGCREEDPLAQRLAQRSHYTVDVVTFSPREGQRLLVELEVKANLGSGLNHLTATLRQHGPGGEEILRQDRVTLDLSSMDATGVLRLYTEVPAATGEVSALSAVVERNPPATEYEEFPEIQAVAGG